MPNLKNKQYEWERERKPGFRRTKRLNDDIDIKLNPNDIFTKEKIKFEYTKGIVGWGKW